METLDTKIILQQMFQDPENAHCFHCSASPVEWISINNAIFICTQCAKVHKKLPNSTSRIISLLSNVFPKEIDVILLGGNRSMRAYLSEFAFSKNTIKAKIKSNAAEYYRNVIKATAEGKVFDEQKPDKITGASKFKKLSGFDRFFNRSKNIQTKEGKILSTYSEIFESSDTKSSSKAKEESERSTLGKGYDYLKIKAKKFKNRLSGRKE